MESSCLTHLNSSAQQMHHETITIPCTPQQNHVAERRNRTLFNMVRSMMAQRYLPISFQGDALLTGA